MSIPPIEVNDIQATVLRPRPSPYKGEYVVIRIDDAAIWTSIGSFDRDIIDQK